MSDNNLDAMLRYDSLAEAEKITGESYKDDDSTTLLGMGLMMDNNERKNAALKATNDTHYSMSFDETLAVFKDLGFEIIFEMPFKGRGGVDERLVVLWHSDGILAKTESYSAFNSTNTADIYYNIRPTIEWEDFWRATSSGGMRGNVWVGHHDVREGLRHNLTTLRNSGEFLTKWVGDPFLWLLSYMDSKVEGYDYDKINAERIAQFPEHVRTAITPSK